MGLTRSATETSSATPPRSAPTAALLGVAVTAAAVGLAEVLTRLGATGPGPVAAVAGVFIDHTPLWLKELAIGWFGTHDKLALGVGIGVVMLLLAVAAGLEERRRRYSGGALVLILGLVAALATVTRPDGGWGSAWPVVLSAAAGGLVLVAVIGSVPGGVVAQSAEAPPAQPTEAPGAAPPAGPGRRQLLQGAGVLTAVAVLGAGASRVFGRPPAGAPIALPPPATAAPVTPTPATTGADFGVPGLSPYRTPNADFYRIDTAFVVPRVDAAGWQLRVHGLVDREVTLTFKDLLAAPLTQAWVTLCCVSNEVGGDLVGNAEWLGLPVRDVLARAGPRPGADMVLSRSVDGFTASTPLEMLTDGRNALLAVAMNGQPLPPEHGYPVRLVVPGLYGYVSATKWVSELEVTRFADATAYWTERGWSPRGPVKLSSRIDVPKAARVLHAGTVTVAGVAWAQHTGVAAVEVRVDRGAWQPAELATDVSIDTWRQWRYLWAATPGEHSLEVRATDRAGHVQTGQRADPVPDGATGWHRVNVRVV